MGLRMAVGLMGCNHLPSCYTTTSVAQIFIKLKFDGLPGLAREFEPYLSGQSLFVSSRMWCKTGGKITTFKLIHPGFDDGTRWYMFP